MKNKTLALVGGVALLGYFAMKSQANAATGSGSGAGAGNYYKNGQLYNSAGNPITSATSGTMRQIGNYFHGTQGGNTTYSGNRGYGNVGYTAGSGTAGYRIPQGYVYTGGSGAPAGAYGGGTGMYGA